MPRANRRTPHSFLQRFVEVETRAASAIVVAAALGKQFDELYDYDAVHRLKHMERGTLNAQRTGVMIGVGRGRRPCSKG